MSGDLSTFKLATLNVHNWVDSHGYDNIERVEQLLKKHQPDILCLQETNRVDQQKFLRHSSSFSQENCRDLDGTLVKFGGCSILSKYPLAIMEKGAKRRRVRCVTAEIQLPHSGDKKPIYITSLHLDHRREPLRLIEFAEITSNLKQLFDENSKQIWTGDFNALTKEDYDKKTWSDIREIRKINHWELPQTDLTSQVKSKGFVDCWERSGRPEPVKTCRFDTRIDYVFANQPFLDDHPLKDIKHIDDRASDHNMVIAEFEI